MAVEKTKALKRKSLESTDQSLKKVKVAKSADRPAPLKSALKGPKSSTSKRDKPKATKADDSLDFEDEAEDDTLTADQTAALLAGFSSSDEDDDQEDGDTGIALHDLPNPPIAAKNTDLTSAISNEPDPESTPGVVYIGRLPHGFYERQMRAYFSQFGDISHLKMPRNAKTGRSKHYAFIEFASAAVADIVSKTMDKYLLFNHILRVQRIPKEHIKEGMWKGESRRKRPMPRNKIERAQLEKGTDADGWSRRLDRENKRRQKKANQLKDFGYDFKMPVIENTAVPALDTPTLERGAEMQLLGDMAQAADEQSNEVDLQPQVVAEATDKKSKKRSSSSAPDSKNAAKRTKGKK